MKDVRRTVMRITEYKDLIAQFENPIEHTCNMKVGMVFIANGGECPEGFCDSAWDSVPVSCDTVTVDAGYAITFAGSADVVGRSRIVNGAIDIGACEYDWLADYSAALGKRVAVTEAAPSVVETALNCSGLSSFFSSDRFMTAILAETPAVYKVAKIGEFLMRAIIL